MLISGFHLNQIIQLSVKGKPVKANVPPKTAQSRVMKCRKLRRSSLMVTVIGDKSYKKYTAAYNGKRHLVNNEIQHGEKEEGERRLTWPCSFKIMDGRKVFRYRKLISR